MKQGDASLSPNRLRCSNNDRFGFQTAADFSDGLAETLSVFDDGQTQEAFALFAETSAGADGDAGFVE